MNVIRAVFVGAAAVLALPYIGTAQTDWRPPTPQMPEMPRIAELRGNWMSPRAIWFQGVDRVSGVAPGELRASGEPGSGTGSLHIARFSAGPVPVVVWSDRNGDARCDLIEIFRDGGVVVQVIDPDYDGTAEFIRLYDTSGALVRQDRM